CAGQGREAEEEDRQEAQGGDTRKSPVTEAAGEDEDTGRHAASANLRWRAPRAPYPVHTCRGVWSGIGERGRQHVAVHTRGSGAVASSGGLGCPGVIAGRRIFVLTSVWRVSCQDGPPVTTSAPAAGRPERASAACPPLRWHLSRPLTKPAAEPMSASL